MERRTNTMGVRSASAMNTELLADLANKYFPELKVTKLGNVTLKTSPPVDSGESIETIVYNRSLNMFLVRNKNNPDFQEVILSKHELIIALAHRMLSLSDGDYLETPAFNRITQTLTKGHFGSLRNNTWGIVRFLFTISPKYEKFLYKLEQKEE